MSEFNPKHIPNCGCAKCKAYRLSHRAYFESTMTKFSIKRRTSNISHLRRAHGSDSIGGMTVGSWLARYPVLQQRRHADFPRPQLMEGRRRRGLRFLREA